ncbi:MAG: Hsp70 family protein [Holosporaceae bacterium]|jgi:molecular chaperone HscA|nr:Hsp70 family protein [Holosporaceae bacterium]
MLTIGIDLGTTMSVVSAIKGGIPEIVKINGRNATPSVVNYSEEKPIVGWEALYKADSSGTILSIKRFMGTETKFLNRNAVEIAADILIYLKKMTEQKLMGKIDAVIITVPAHFSDLQRTATKQAASIAGIRVLRLINEPTAAAIAFGLDKKTNGIFAVYDFGGGTFDFSILRLSNNIFQVLATGGDNYLGGDDIDEAILSHNFQLNGIDISGVSEYEKNRGKLIAKSLKEKLGDNKIIYEDYIFENKKYRFMLSRETLKNLTNDFVQKTLKISDQVLVETNITSDQINGIVLVGGMTKLRLVKYAVKMHFGVEVLNDINPEEAVARGAAIYANSITKENNTLLIDVVPLTLGVETFGGGVDRIIHRNTPIPITKKREYTTYENNQTGIKFHVVQGERPIAKECRSLAKFELKNIPPMPAGAPRVTTEFSVDVNGLLSVTACEKHTGISQSIVIEPSAGLTNDEIVSIIEKANANRNSDSIEEFNMNVKIESERMMKFWESVMDKIPSNAKKRAKKAMKNLKNALRDGRYHEAISCKNDLESIFGEFLEEIINSNLIRKTINKDQLE